MRVVTITPNPAIDQTIVLDRLVPGEVHRARSTRQDAGGKGVNVASCLADRGVPTTVLGVLGEDNAAPFAALFAAKRIDDRMLRVPGATRVNLKIVDDAGTTDINMAGPAAAGERIAAVLAEAEAMAGPDTLVVLAGSLPPACPADIYAGAVARLRARRARVILDTSGPPLALALGADTLPDCVKPNRHELAEWADEALPTTADVVRVAMRLQARGVALVVVSMGGDGALFVSGGGALTARLRAEAVASTVGAGDAMVAGIAAAMVEGADLERTARLATAFAVGKLGRVGPHLPDRATIERMMQDVIIAAVQPTRAALAGETT